MGIPLTERMVPSSGRSGSRRLFNGPMLAILISTGYGCVGHDANWWRHRPETPKFGEASGEQRDYKPQRKRQISPKEIKTVLFEWSTECDFDCFSEVREMGEPPLKSSVAPFGPQCM